MSPQFSYCNPLPLPDFQRGRACGTGSYAGPDFREMADPTVIRFGDSWHLFPSAGLHWKSRDMIKWQFQPITPFDPGYAPTVAAHQGWLYLSASWDGSAVWRARSPEGPWERLGQEARDADGNVTWLRDHHGRPVRWGDPCLFFDEDGELYCYCNLGRSHVPDAEHPWHIRNDVGIFGVRLDPQDPSRFAEEPVKLIAFNPEHWWERTGEFNQRLEDPILEGAWMTKKDGRYYLQYSANGTEYRNYAVGCYIGASPLGPFVPQQHNPVLIHRGGLLNGCAHHSVVEGPDSRLWCFYTILIRANHPYERRIAMDPIHFDERGELHIDGPSEVPRVLSATQDDPTLLPLSVNCRVSASGYVPGRNPEFATDNSLRTWWEAGDLSDEWLELDLEGLHEISSARTIFADQGLDYAAGHLPGPYQYRILGSLDGREWHLLADRTENLSDQHISYDGWMAVTARHVRLEVLSAPHGLRIAVSEFTVFGLPQPSPIPS